jgi:hypothetical protein
VAEEKAEKKKPVTIKRILEWIGVACLALLVLAPVHFRVPCKPVALLLIFLSACTVLPRPARKWFWAAVGVVILALIIWVFLPEDNEGWRPYTFDEELAALEAKYAIPDSENAATVYNQLLADYGSDSFFPEFWDWPVHHDIVSQEWSREDHPELAQWLAGHEDTIEELLAAVKRPKYRCAIGADPLDRSGPMRERLHAVRQWANLLVYAANNDLAEGRTDQALQKLFAAVQMGQHLCQQPMMIDLLVGIAVEGTVLKSLNGFVATGEAKEEHLSLIEQMLGQIRHGWSEDLPRLLEGEKLWVKNLIGMLAYEVNDEGKVRFNRDPHAVAKLENPGCDFATTEAQMRRAKVAAMLNWFVLPSSPKRASKMIDDSYERLYAMAQPDFSWPKESMVRSLATCMHLTRWEYLIWLWTGPDKDIYYRIHDMYQQRTAENRAAQLIVGLRRYKNRNGRWPETLEHIRSLAPAEAFVDPSNGGAFVYRLRADGFIIYSKGRNNIDEGGKRWYESDDSGADDQLFWPPERPTRRANAG